MTRCLISGITGQIGSYLAELLLNKGCEVHGIIRPSSNFTTNRIEHLYRDPHKKDLPLYLHYGDLADSNGLQKLIDKIEPAEIYNLGAVSHVKVSFEMPEHTLDIVGNSVLRLLEAIKTTNKNIKFYQASSSEMFGSSPPPQNENTKFHPCSPYGCAKAVGYYLAQNYRESYNMFVVNGILFNTESPRRHETFVTRKITRAVGRIAAGTQDKLYLGNLRAQRDWGYAKEYVEAIYKMMQLETPEDFVIGTGEMHSVEEFVQLAFSRAGIHNWQNYVEIDENYKRPCEVNALKADNSKAKNLLNWQPTTAFKELVHLMTDHDILLAQTEK